MNPIRFKATDPVIEPGTQQNPQPELDKVRAEEVKVQLEEALQELYQARSEFAEYESLPEHAELEIQEARLKASLAIINNFLATGILDPTLGGGARPGMAPGGDATAQADYLRVMNETVPGWNGN